MLVIVGSPTARFAGDRAIVAAGLASTIARAAAAAGAAVQVVGRVGDDASGDGVLLDLASAGVGHVAVLRAAGSTTPLAAEPTPDDADDEPARAALDDDEAHGDAALAASGLPLDAGDLDLALRYLPDYRVLIVLPGLDQAAITTVVGAAAWSGAHLVLIDDGRGLGSDLPADATILEQPQDADTAFAAVVARYAVELDRGTDPATAFAAASGDAGWLPVEA